MTEKLYYTEPQRYTFSARVLSCTVNKGRWEIALDRTAFFPEGGGQGGDTGTLGGVRVLDTHERDGEILHYCDGALSVGAAVDGAVDRAVRFARMQIHSGEHIVSGTAHREWGCENVGFHMTEQAAVIDFDREITPWQLSELERLANEAVWANLPFHILWPTPEELEHIAFRQKKELTGTVRLVEVPGVDCCACCAPHVRRTGEIGLIKVIRTLRERSGIRLTILCGSRALAYMQTLQKAAEDVSHLTNMPREEIAAGTARILNENERLRQREAALESAVTEALAASVPAEQQDVFLFTEGADGSSAGIGNLAQRRLVNTLCEKHPGYCGVFAGNDETGYRYIIGATGTGDARALNACMKKYCAVRGGGKPAMVQGSVQSTEEMIRTALRKSLYELSES
jgi:alanyl-tRNA synthetase